VLTSAFVQLSKNSELQKRLRRQVSNDDATGSSDSNATTKELLEALIAESQRVYPAAPFTMRVVDKDDLEVGGFRVPKGWLVTYAIAGTLLSDEAVYPVPNDFNIDRWLVVDGPDNQRQRPPVWAFGGGKRMCPGKSLNILESVTLFRAVLGKNGFEWKLTPEQDLSYRYTPGFFPVDGLKVRIFCSLRVTVRSLGEDRVRRFI